MSLNIYYGNDLEKLILEKCIPVIQESPPTDPFQKEIIVVQNQGMAIWLKQFIAREMGIACNIDFPFINGFINQVLEESLDTPPDKDYFHPYVMTWKLWELIGVIKSKFPDLRNYLEQDNSGLKQFQLAAKLAHCFDQYQIYRPREILAGLKNIKAYQWQQHLWEKLSQGKINRAEGFKHFFSKEKASAIRPANRINIIGVFSLPPVFIEFFNHLSDFIDVNIFLPFPVDLVPYLTRPAGDLYNTNYSISEHINPLLDTLGKAGLDFFQLLKQTQAEFYPFFISENSHTLLALLKKSLLKKTNPPQIIQNETIPTIQLHNCHSKMREVEVLRNNLLHLINTTTINPADIVVMMPNIADYSPYIKSVFDREDISSNHPDIKIPYTITDNSITFSTGIDEIFLQLLNLHRTRFEASFIIDLLSKEAIYKKLQLTEEDIERIRKWIADTNIRWGLNGTQREKDFDLINFDENSWEKGLNRMFLGFCLKDDDYPKLHYSYLPYDQFEGHNVFVLGKLSLFISKLTAVHETFKNTCKISEWQDKLYALTEDFFYDNEDFQQDLKLLRQKINKLSEETKLAETKVPVAVDILLEYFQENLSDEFQTGRYFRGGVTISTLQPLRNIPNKVVCLLGMNDNEFPRNEHFNSFNIIGDERRCGDRIKREEDQYLFLEAVLSAKEYLLISYIGQHKQTNEVAEPASPVCELRDYLKKLFSDAVMEKIYFEHKLQAHHPLYFTSDNFISYSTDDYLSQQKISVAPFYSGPIPAETFLRELSIDDLIRHLGNSSKFFLENSLGARIVSGDNEIKDAEDFDLDNLQKYLIQAFIQQQLIKDNSADFIYSVLKAEDRLPVGLKGREVFTGYYEEMAKFLDTEIPPLEESLLTGLRNSRSIHFDKEINGIRLFGTLPPLYNDKFLYTRYAGFKGKDGLKSWLFHLIGTIQRTNTQTIVITKDDKIRLLPPLDPEKAEEHLIKILQLYKQSLQQPLPFFPATSLDFVTHIIKPNKSKIDKAKSTWSNKFIANPEYQDPYFKIFFTQEDLESQKFADISRLLLAPFARDFAEPEICQAEEIKR